MMDNLDKKIILGSVLFGLIVFSLMLFVVIPGSQRGQEERIQRFETDCQNFCLDQEYWISIVDLDGMNRSCTCQDGRNLLRSTRH